LPRGIVQKLVPPTVAVETRRGDMTQDEAISTHLRQLQIICVAIMSGVVIFSGVVWYLLASGAVSPSLAGTVPYLGTLLNLMGLSLLVIAHYFPVLMKAPGRDASQEDFVAWHRVSTVIAYAIREGAAIMALVGVLLTGRTGMGSAVVGLAIVAMILAWPKTSQLEYRG
jgi:hypothetical protein